MWSLLRLLLLALCVAVGLLCLALLLLLLFVVGHLGELMPVLAVIALVAAACAAAALHLWSLPKSRAWRRVALCVLAGIVAFPFLAFAAFDAAWFYPRLQHGRAQVTDASLGTDPRLTALLERGYGHGLEHVVARGLLYQSGFEAPGRNAWRFEEMFSTWLLELHSDRAEQRALLATLAYTGSGGHGLQVAARRLYGRDLHELDTEQLASVVALIMTPSMEKHPEQLAKRAQWLMQALPDAR
jgi:hypothetical protein